MDTVDINLHGRLIARAVLANNFWLRLRGLLGRDLAVGGGLLLLPCRQIHTFFMRYPIDAVYLNQEGLVLRVDKGVKPWRGLPREKRAWAVLELPVYKTAAEGIVPGLQLFIADLAALNRRKQEKQENPSHLDCSLPQLRQRLDQLRFSRSLLGYSREPVQAYIAELCDAAIYEHQDHQRAILALQRNIALANEDVLTAETRARNAEQRELHLLEQTQALRRELAQQEALIKAKAQQMEKLRQEKDALLQEKEGQLVQLRQDITAGRYI